LFLNYVMKNIPKYKGGSFFLGPVSEFLDHNQFDFFKKLGSKGNILKFRAGLGSIIFIADPKYIKHILQGNYKNYKKDYFYKDLSLALGSGLVTSEGKYWKKQRKLSQPAFHKKSIDNFSEIMKEEALLTITKWNSLENNNINLLQEMKEVTMSIVSRCLFDIDIKRNAKELSNAIDGVLEYLDNRMNTIIRIPGRPILPTSNYKNFKNNLKIIKETFIEIINAKRKNIEEPYDLLDMLILAQDEDTGEGMSNEQLVDEIITLFVAGHETTATTMTWFYYSLNKFQGINKNFYHQLSSLNDVNQLQVSDILSFDYIHLLVQEVMRFYPTVWGVGRESINEDNLFGYKISKGETITIPILYMHHHPEYWDSPDQFNPERFRDVDVEKDLKWIYMPFGEGPRKCIGNNFAMLEIFILATMFSKEFNIHIENIDDIKFHNGITSKPQKDIFARIEKNKF